MAEPLRPVAQSADGVIEALELKDPGRLPFLLAVQFHPERMLDGSALFLRLFSGFVRACSLAEGEIIMKPKVMVVDDTEGMRDLSSAILRKRGL